MAIIVTGTPGTGKTTIARILAKEKSYMYIDVNSLIKKKKWYEYYDRKRKCYVVDDKKIAKKLEDLIRKNNKVVIDSHLSHYVNPKYIEYCVVTKCSLKTLEKRLKKRHYSKEKIRENLDSEIFDICLTEAKERKHKVKVIITG